MPDIAMGVSTLSLKDRRLPELAVDTELSQAVSEVGPGPPKVCVRTSLWFTGISFAKKLWAALHTLLLLVMPLCNKSRSTECTVGCMLVFYLQTTFREGAALRAAI